MTKHSLLSPAQHDRLKIYRKQYYLDNKDRLKAGIAKWYQDNKEQIAEKRRFYHLRSTYGITEDVYRRMLADQGGACAICGKIDNQDGNREQKLNIDHDHQTGIVRGLLCWDCNKGLGSFRDDSRLVSKVLNYLTGREIT